MISRTLGFLAFLLALLALLLTPAKAQSVKQSGAVTPNHPACWVTTGFINDCGVPAITPYVLASPPLTLTDAATVTPDLSQAVTFSWTLTAVGRTLANPANLNSSMLGQRVMIFIIQGGSGSNTITSWGSVYKFPSGTKPTLSTAAGATDRVTCEIETTTVLTCNSTLNYQ